MRILSLNDFRRLRNALIRARRRWISWRTGALIDPDTSISLSARFVSGGKGSIVIGAGTLVAFRVLVLSRCADGRSGNVTIGRNCFIGGGSTILPGTTIGDGSIVGAGSVVFDDVPPRTICVGNPARVIRADVATGRFGRLESASVNQARYYKR